MCEEPLGAGVMVVGEGDIRLCSHFPGNHNLKYDEWKQIRRTSKGARLVHTVEYELMLATSSEETILRAGEGLSFCAGVC